MLIGLVVHPLLEQDFAGLYFVLSLSPTGASRILSQININSFSSYICVILRINVVIVLY